MKSLFEEVEVVQILIHSLTDYISKTGKLVRESWILCIEGCFHIQHGKFQRMANLVSEISGFHKADHFY